MANCYFQFKQFTIQQDKCAMKVCTDACLFGAYVANYLYPKKVNSILDIGTGTGLLSLMLAQKNNTVIDAVELNTDAYKQAKENISATIWKENITVYNVDINRFTINKKYDFIISNPPFFEGDLTSEHKNKNQAKHDEGLTLTQLLKVIKALLSAKGNFAVLLPYHRLTEFEKLAEDLAFYCTKEILLKQTSKHQFFRGILFFSAQKENKTLEEITIKEPSNLYTPEFIDFLKDYYLFL